MTYFQDFIYALKGVVVPFLLIFLGATILGIETSPYGPGFALVGLAFFLMGIAWVAYLSFFSRD